MSRYVSTLVTLTLLLCGGAALQAQTVGPLPEGLRQDVTEQLVSDQWEAKRQAISRMLATPPEQRPSEWVSAVLDEVASFQLDSSTPEWIPAGEADHEVGWTLYGDMLEIACEARDERAIPVLVKAVSVGNPVIGALADFGDKAVQPIVEAMRNAAPDHVATSLSALALMVARHPTLSPAHKATISRLGRERLVGRQHPAMVRVAIEVAFAVKDADSLAALQRLSTAGSASAAGLEISFNPQSFPNLRERATLALEAAQTGRPLTRPGRPRTPR